MNKMGLEYGKWLSTYDWNFIATFRPHYRLTELSSDSLMKRLSKDKSIYNLFFALEKDYSPNMFHVHLLIDGNPTLTRESLTSKLGVSSKAVSYFEPVEDVKKVAEYCTKHISKKLSHHNFFNKQMTFH